MSRSSCTTTALNSGTAALDVDDIRQLHDDGVIQGLKSSANIVQQVHEVRAALEPSFRIFYGSFNAPIEGAAGGADGWLSGILNVTTADAVQLWRAVSSNDFEEARRIWRTRILPVKYLYTKNLFAGTSDQAIYRAMLELRGHHGGHSRIPLLPLSDEQRDRLRSYLDAADLL